MTRAAGRAARRRGRRAPGAGPAGRRRRAARSAGDGPLARLGRARRPPWRSTPRPRRSPSTIPPPTGCCSVPRPGLPPEPWSACRSTPRPASRATRSRAGSPSPSPTSRRIRASPDGRGRDRLPAGHARWRCRWPTSAASSGSLRCSTGAAAASTCATSTWPPGSRRQATIAIRAGPPWARHATILAAVLRAVDAATPSAMAIRVGVLDDASIETLRERGHHRPRRHGRPDLGAGRSDRATRHGGPRAHGARDGVARRAAAPARADARGGRRGSARG